jgi:hypothetical protein
MTQSSDSPSKLTLTDWIRITILAVIAVLFVGIIVWISNIGKKQGLMEENFNSNFKRLAAEQEASSRRINEIASQLANIPSIIQSEVERVVTASPFRQAVRDAQTAAEDTRKARETAEQERDQTQQAAKAVQDLLPELLKKGSISGVWAAQPRSDVVMQGAQQWGNIRDTVVTFNLDRPAKVFFAYSILVEHEGRQMGIAAVKLLLNGMRSDESATFYEPHTQGPRANLVGFLVKELRDGPHTVALQWMTTGGSSWSNRPSSAGGSIAGRSLIVIAFYQVR